MRQQLLQLGLQRRLRPRRKLLELSVEFLWISLIVNCLFFSPTVKPTLKPTVKPTIKPTVVPTRNPTVKPTVKPSTKPSEFPTSKPTSRYES